MLFDFNRHEEHARKFLQEIAIELNTSDYKKAGRILTAVFHALRDHLSVNESLQFIAQLPLYLKGIYVEKWKPSQHLRTKSEQEFIETLKKYHPTTAALDFSTYENAKQEIQAVFKVIRKYVSAGEINDIKSQLPMPIANLI